MCLKSFNALFEEQAQNISPASKYETCQWFPLWLKLIIEIEQKHADVIIWQHFPFYWAPVDSDKGLVIRTIGVSFDVGLNKRLKNIGDAGD